MFLLCSAKASSSHEENLEASTEKPDGKKKDVEQICVRIARPELLARTEAAEGSAWATSSQPDAFL